MAGGSKRDYQAALGLAWVSGANGHSMLRLLREESPHEVWTASVARLEERGLNREAAKRFDENRRSFSAAGAQDALRASGLRFVPLSDPYFPAELRQLALPPAGLFMRGTPAALAALLTTPRVTIVGTRRATAYGTRAAETFAMAFAAAGVAVVSGMAFGVDTRAHKAALAMGGLTVAVLGCGADVVYPGSNRWLYDKIAEEGIVFSELPPGTRPAPWTFPHRNRLLAALGDAVLVAEGSRTSGALQTANAALELGRPVFAVPGSIYAEGYRGCNHLLHEGANPAIEAEGAVEDFLFQTRIERGPRQMRSDRRGASAGRSPGEPDSPTETRNEIVRSALVSGSCSVDAVVVRTGLQAREVAAALAELELERSVTKVGPGMFARAP